MRILLLVCLMLIGCSTPVKPDIPVYTPPTFEMPVRPVLTSDGEGNFDKTTRDAEQDLIFLKTYSLELENILNELKTTNPQK